MTGHQQIKTKAPWYSMDNDTTQAIVGAFVVDAVIVIAFFLVIA